MANEKSFLRQKYQNLHKSDEVLSAKERTESRESRKLPTDPDLLITNYLQRFKEIFDREDPKERERGIEVLRVVLHRNETIKTEDIPYGAFKLEQDIAEELGHGRPEITNRFIELKTKEIQEDQRESLDYWIDYLSSSDAMYPDWFKYWVARSVLKMGTYDKAKNYFLKEVKKQLLLIQF